MSAVYAKRLNASDKVHGSLPENYKTSLKAVEQLLPGR